MRISVPALVLCSLGLWSPLPAASVTSPGDVVVAGHTFAVTPDSPFDGKLIVFSNQGVMRGELFSQPLQVFLHPEFLPGNSDFLVAVFASTAGNVVRLNRDGAVLASSAYYPVATSGIVVSGSGSFYVSALMDASILRFDAAGQYLGSLPINDGAESIDLAADQCTLYYVANTKLGRVNVCTGQLFPPLTTSLPYVSHDLRILADGSILVASSFSMVLFASNGTLLRTFPVPAGTIALDIDRHSVWATSRQGQSVGISKIDLSSGNIVLGPADTGLSDVYGLAVYGEPRAALITSIPAASDWVLVALAACLAAVGAAALRLRL